MAVSVVFTSKGPLGLEFEVDAASDHVVVVGVTPGGQGAQLGVRVGQVVASVQNKPRKSGSKTLKAMKQKRPLTVGFEQAPAPVGAKSHDIIPRSPFGQRRCVLVQPPTGDLQMSLGTDLVVQQVAPGGAASAAGVPTGWKVMAIDEARVFTPVQFAVMLSRLEPGARVTLLLQPATEEEKMAAVASKWAAIHRGRHARNPPPEVPAGGGSDEEKHEHRSPGGSRRTPSRHRSTRMSNASTPKQDRTGRWYTAPEFTPGQEHALRRIQAAGRGLIARQGVVAELSRTLSQVNLTSPSVVGLTGMNSHELRALAEGVCVRARVGVCVWVCGGWGGRAVRACVCARV